MENQTLTLDQAVVKQLGGVVVLDVAKFQVIQKMLEEYQNKERLVRSMQKFQTLSGWGERFAKEKGITESQVLAND